MAILIRCAGAILLLGLGGCANTFGGVDTHRISPTEMVISQPANVRSAYKKGDLLCAEPPPDAALQAVASATAKVSTKAGTAVEAGGNLQTSIIQLAGRTQVVLIARDAFTANCMLAMNGFITPEDSQKNFQSTLGVIATIAKADEKSAQAAATNANTEAVKTAMVAKSLEDQAISKLVDELMEQQTIGAAAVLARFTSKDGKFLDAELLNFSKDKSVVAILGKGGAETLGKIKTKDDLIFLLTHSYMDSAQDLGALAKSF